MPKTKGKIARISFRAAQPIHIDDENWKTIERAYGQSVSKTIRTQIEECTARFLQLAVAVAETGSMNDAIKRISSLRKCAQALLDAINGPRFEEMINRTEVVDPVREYVDDVLADTYALLNYDKPFPSRNYVSLFAIEVGRFRNACEETLDFAMKHKYWSDGAAWDIWIRELIGILKAHELPTGVRKDLDKNKSGRSSAFVEFVRSLQTFIPKQHSRSQHSLGALGTAINKSRAHSKSIVTSRKAAVRKTGRDVNKLQP